jgi:hypothetical protein
MMQKGALRTQFSLQASSLADSYRNTVGRITVGPHGYSPDMTAPEGQSTGGGVQALQHLRLLPPRPNMPTILVGHANQRERVAEIRTWEHVDAICRERFKQGAPLDPAAYQEFLQAAQGFLAACGLRVAVVPTPEAMRVLMADRAVADDAPAATPKKGLLAVGIAGGVVALAVAVAVWMLVVAR